MDKISNKIHIAVAILRTSSYFKKLNNADTIKITGAIVIPFLAQSFNLNVPRAQTNQYILINKRMREFKSKKDSIGITSKIPMIL